MSSKAGGKSAVQRGAAKPSRIPEGTPTIVVRDSNGQDVTPRSLLAGNAQGLVIPRTAEIEQLASVSESQSFAFDSAMGGKSSTGSEAGDPPMSGTKTPELEDSDAELTEKPKAKKASAADAAADSVAPTEEQLDTLVTLELRETETFWLLDIPGTAVAMDSAAAAGVQAANAVYEQLLRNRQDMGDMYVEREAQTFNGAKKQKEVQTRPEPTAEVGTQANLWDIHDAAEGAGDSSGHRSRAISSAADGGEAMVAPTAGGTSGGALGATSGEGSSQSFADVTSSFLDGASGGGNLVQAAEANASMASSTAGKPAHEVSLRNLHNLPSVMRVVERMVAQNVYHPKHLTYRNIQQRGTQRRAEAAGGHPSIERLWGFECETSAGRNISCVEWNPENKDMLAVGYGEFDFSKQRAGLILFWSLKNPEFPDKMITLQGNNSGVTSIAFSALHPYLLAVGLYDGTVCIFDVRKNDSKPILESGHGSGGKHTDPVWQLAWVDQGAEKGEILVSISTDGRVTQWNMKKGREHVNLMSLKRVAPSAKQSGAGSGKDHGSEGIISRKAAGLCVAFSHKETQQYLAGTEDGHIHRCSCSYNEQVSPAPLGLAGVGVGWG